MLYLEGLSWKLGSYVFIVLEVSALHTLICSNSTCANIATVAETSISSKAQAWLLLYPSERGWGWRPISGAGEVGLENPKNKVGCVRFDSNSASAVSDDGDIFGCWFCHCWCLILIFWIFDVLVLCFQRREVHLSKTYEEEEECITVSISKTSRFILIHDSCLGAGPDEPILFH
jgi:hypothetical protein